MSTAIHLAESGVLPDAVVRFGIRRLIRARLRELAERSPAEAAAWRRSLAEGPVAELPELANEQHYEIPAELFRLVLGRRLKYSCCWWPVGVEDLDAAEEASLAQVGERALLEDGQSVLDLGCGWGSFSLWAAERFPSSRLLAVSNSAPQRAFIEGRARELGLVNLEVVTCDVNDFEPGRRFDRIVSIEMMEHARNWDELQRRLASWLADEGRAFVHVFCHREEAYPMEDAGDDDWMARHFFSGGHFPDFALAGSFPERLRLEESWKVSGRHYARTAEAWLENLDARRDDVRRVLAAAAGESAADAAVQRWRMFFMACAELFAHEGGDEWLVGHYRLARP